MGSIAIPTKPSRRGAEQERLKAVYFKVFPDGRARQQWPGLAYVRVRPIWIRYSDFSQDAPMIVEFDARELGAAAAIGRDG